MLGGSSFLVPSKHVSLLPRFYQGQTFYIIKIFSCQNKRCWATSVKLRAFAVKTLKTKNEEIKTHPIVAVQVWEEEQVIVPTLCYQLAPSFQMMYLIEQEAAAHSGEFLRITSQWNFKYGTAMTLGIQTPGSFPLEYETFIHNLIRQILIFTITVINIWTHYKHIRKKWNKIAPPKRK